MRMTDQENPDVTELESQFLDAGPNEGNARHEVTVDEDVPVGSRDQVIREAFASDVIEIPGDAEWRKRFGPIGIGLRARSTGRGEDRRERNSENQPWLAAFVPRIQNRYHVYP